MVRILLSMLVTLAVAACSGTPHVTQVQTGLAEYTRVIIPADGLEGQTYTEVGRVEFALNQYGEKIYGKTPSGETKAIVSRVQFNGTYSAPAALQLAGMILPGMIQVGGQYLLQERCINSSRCGGGSGGTPVQINNLNNNQAYGSGEVQVSAGPGVPIH